MGMLFRTRATAGLGVSVGVVGKCLLRTWVPVRATGRIMSRSWLEIRENIAHTTAAVPGMILVLDKKSGVAESTGGDGVWYESYS